MPSTGTTQSAAFCDSIQESKTERSYRIDPPGGPDPIRAGFDQEFTTGFAHAPQGVSGRGAHRALAFGRLADHEPDVFRLAMHGQAFQGRHGDRGGGCAVKGCHHGQARGDFRLIRQHAQDQELSFRLHPWQFRRHAVLQRFVV